MLARLREDVSAVRGRDPAARSTLEVLLCYPGVHALALHRLAHLLWQKRWSTAARAVSHLSRFLTGIEIHPGAVIGRRVFIDHGMGVVIGETAVVGDDCTIYQGVTLGGTSLNHGKRHPTLEAGVVVGAGAKVLGPFVVGTGARVGSNSVVLKPVDAGVSVAGIPARVVVSDNIKPGATASALSPSFERASAEEVSAEGVSPERVSARVGFAAYAVAQDAEDPLAVALHRLIDRVAEQDRQIAALRDALARAGIATDGPGQGSTEGFDASALNRMVD
jgi:serine O-acetyltransferase